MIGMTEDSVAPPVEARESTSSVPFYKIKNI